MNQKNIITALAAAIAGALGALIVCSFFFLYYKPTSSAEIPKPIMEQQPTPPKQTEPSPVPQAKIKESDVLSLTIETDYRGFYAEGSRCRQSNNEYFKTTGGAGSSGSPCSVKLTFSRDGDADKSIEVRRYDSNAKEWSVVERNVWKGKSSAEEFMGLARLIVNNEAFKSWNDGMMLTVSNCKITVRHAAGTKSPMSNVDEKTTVYLRMVGAFKDLDAKINWQKAD